MDGMSCRARLAKSNINILNIEWNSFRTVADVYYEFMYHPHHGQTKWCKTWTTIKGRVEDKLGTRLEVKGDDILNALESDVLSLRKELEG